MELCRGLSGVKYSSDKPSMDSFEPHKLGQSSTRGFTAERFLKPPVTVYIHFPCSVILEKILIENSRGVHVSTGLEVYSYACASGHQPDEQPTYKLIGKSLSLSPGTVTFINRRVNEAFTHSSHALSSHDRSLINLCRIVALRITRTLNGTLPVIAGLSIFGRPHDLSYCANSRTTPSPTGDASQTSQTLTYIPSESALCERDGTIKSATHFTSTLGNTERGKRSDSINRSITTVVSGTSASVKNPLNIHSGIDIPDEFIDLITMEVMSQPVILPSGKTIDQSTLDRHVENLSSWGLKPCDPFTGKLFDTEVSWQKPLLNISLKERIDKFTLTHHIPNGKSLRRKASWENESSLVGLPHKKSKSKQPASSLNDEVITATSTMNERINKLVNASPTKRVLSLDASYLHIRTNEVCSLSRDYQKQ